MTRIYTAKIKTLSSLKQILKCEREKDRRVVAMSGSMDLLQAGHVWALTEAKKQGDILVVLLNSDSSIKKYKGPHRPIVPEMQRAQLVAALECVDYVVLFNQINPVDVLRVIKPDVYCNSSEWGKDCIESPVISAYGGKIHVLQRKGGPSTTEIISRIHEAGSHEEIRAVFLDRDGTINENGEGYIHKKKDFKFLPGVIPGLKKLTSAGFLLFVVTNQSGVGRGMYSERSVKLLHNYMKAELEKEGVKIHGVYYCPHTPTDNCECRKPGSAMFVRAVAEHGVNLSKSWMIGDTQSDVLAGRCVNLTVIKIGSTKEGESVLVGPHYYAKDFSEAVRIIMSKTRGAKS